MVLAHAKAGSVLREKLSRGEKRDCRCRSAVTGLAPRLRDGLDQIVESNEGPADSRGQFPDHSTPGARADDRRA